MKQFSAWTEIAKRLAEESRRRDDEALAAFEQELKTKLLPSMKWLDRYQLIDRLMEWSAKDDHDPRMVALYTQYKMALRKEVFRRFNKLEKNK